MKKLLLMILVLALLAININCGGGGGSGGSAGTSLVTITVGDSMQTASLKVEKNTLFAQAKMFFRNLIKSDLAVAAIPRGVDKIVFTIAASDMATITKDVLVAGQTSITETFYVPNGNKRHFLVKAIDGSSNVLFKGETFADLDGRPLSLTIDMVLITWAKTYGGTGNDYAYSIQQTSDGGYIVAGRTASFGAGGMDIWVLKLDSAGGIQWQKTYGGTGDDYAYSIQQTSDGGYIVAGDTLSFGAGNRDIWVLKLDSAGGIQWQKTYGGTGDDYAYSTQQTYDGGYIVAGVTYSFDPHAGGDIWVLKLDSAGGIQWQKTYGDTVYDDYVYSIQQTSDDGYIIGGLTYSFDEYGSGDIWVLKLDSAGRIQWQKTYGSTGFDSAYSIQQTFDGGYIIAGDTLSFGAGNRDIWVLKLDSTGRIQWQKTYGSTSCDTVYSIQQTFDGGYIIAGDTLSFGAGGWDIWVLKLGRDGGIQWQKTYGGTDSDSPYSIQQTSDGGYIIAGRTRSFGARGDCGEEGPCSDFWVLRLRSDGTLGCELGRDTNAIPTNTSVSGKDTEVEPTETTASEIDTSVTGQNTSATVNTQCVGLR